LAEIVCKCGIDLIKPDNGIWGGWRQDKVGEKVLYAEMLSPLLFPLFPLLLIERERGGLRLESFFYYYISHHKFLSLKFLGCKNDENEDVML